MLLLVVRIEKAFSIKDILRQRGEEYSQWAFGESWDAVKIKDAISMWNRAHPDANISEEGTIRGSLKTVGEYMMREGKI